MLPYAPTGQEVEPGLTLAHHVKALTDELCIESLWVTFKPSFIATVFAILPGYPLASQIVRADSVLVRGFLVMMVAIPFLTNLIVRLYALIPVLDNAGWINKLPIATALMTENEIFPPVPNDLGVGIGLTCYVPPFVVFALAAALRRLDSTLEEAAMNLGADQIVTFFKVTLPLIRPGLFAGALFAFRMSFDDFTVTIFLIGTDTHTLPVAIYQ